MPYSHQAATRFCLTVPTEKAVERLYQLDETARSGVRGVPDKVGIVETSKDVVLVPPGGKEWGQGGWGVVARMALQDEDSGSRATVRFRLGESSVFTLVSHGALALLLMGLWLLPFQGDGPWAAIVLAFVIVDVATLLDGYFAQRRLLLDVISRALGPVKDHGDVHVAPPYR